MEQGDYNLIGPFSQLLTLDGLPERGSIKNDQLNIQQNMGILVKDGSIAVIAKYEDMRKDYLRLDPKHIRIEESMIGLPGFIDAHTHICFAGSRHIDYSSRNAGVSYLEIARAGGGIWDTVKKTREESSENLFNNTKKRALQAGHQGITTLEVKSGYGLSVKEELKQLRAIDAVKSVVPIDLVATCLAAHILPKDFEGSQKDYLALIMKDLFPVLQKEDLCKRIDIFIEEDAFEGADARRYMQKAKLRGFDICVHGDQFSAGGSALAIEMGAISVDHLEASGNNEIKMLGKSNTVAMVLPGASLGLGCNFAPARKLLDAGAIVAIASDWNPGSAPMGNLLTQAAILGASEKLTDAEVFAGMTSRAAKALNFSDRGIIKTGKMADIIGFQAQDFREILYHQGQLKVSKVWKRGQLIN